MHTDEYNSIKTDVELLKRDVSANHALYQKIDSAIEKMAEVSNNISKMLIIHENKLDNHANQIDGIRTTIVERKVDFEKQVHLLQLEMDKHHNEEMALIKEHIAEHKSTCNALDTRIESLEAWKWYVLGIAAAVGTLMSLLPVNLSTLLAG